MRDRHHRQRENLIVIRRQDLLARAGGGELVAGAGGAAHAERIPADPPFQFVVVFKEHDEHLVAARRIGRAPRRGDNTVGGLAIGDDARHPVERDARFMGFDRRRAAAQIAAAVALGRRGGEQQLLAGNAPHQPLVPGAAAAMARDARHFGLMHGEYHRRGGASAAERVADIDDIADARAFAAEFTRNCRAQKTRGARGGDRFGRNAGIAIHGGGVSRGDGRDLFGAGREAFSGPGSVPGNVQAPRRPAGRRNGMLCRRPRGHGCTHRYSPLWFACVAIAIARQVLPKWQKDSANRPKLLLFFRIKVTNRKRFA